MPSNFITMSIHDCIHTKWNGMGRQLSLNSKLVSKENTYIVVFGTSQDEYLQWLENNKKVKILHKAKKSVNGVPGHGLLPRNTLVVFELV